MTNKNLWIIAAAVVAVALSGGIAQAQDVTPSFASAPTGWTVDRYAPDSFGNIGTAYGHDSVLGIGIGPNGSTANRLSGYSANFYSTQGMGTPVSGGGGSSVSSMLYIPSSWMDPTNGAVRTDMWVGVNGTPAGADGNYGIVGFTNQGTGIADVNNANLHDSYIGLRIWNDLASQWTDITGNINLDAWNTLTVTYTASNTFDYVINGVDEGSFAAIGNATGLSSVMLEAFNFDGNSNQPGAVIQPYMADWANVPEPASMSVLGLGLAGLGAARRRRR